MAQFAGGNGRGDVQLALVGPATAQFAGGSGRGDVALAFAGSAPSQFAGGIGRGDVQLAIAGPASSQFAGGNGRGDVRLAFAGSAGSQFLGGNGRGDVQMAVAGPAGSQFAGGNGRGDVQLAFGQGQLLLAPRGILEGPYNSGTGLMSDALRAAGLVPTGEPYTALGYPAAGVGGATTGAGVLTNTGNNAIVDWVVVELRDANAPGTVLRARTALIQRDGDIVDLDGVSPLGFNQFPGSYYVALKHRNHLGVMTQSAVALGLSTTPLDLSLASTTTYGTNARKSLTGTFPALALWAGDVTFNGEVKYTGSGNDRDPILITVGSTTPNNVLSNTYSTRDVNLNGEVKYTGSGNDRDPILVNVGSTTPNNVRVQQLP